MSTTFPTTKQTIPNPTATDLLENASPTLDHDYQHATINDTVEALEDKVGIDGSVVTTSHSYKLALITGANQAVSTDGTGQTLTNITLTNPQMNFGGDATGDMYYRNASGVTTRLPIGSTGNIIQTSVAGIPEWIANPAAADASTTVKGVVEEATQAEVNSGASVGGTGAKLFITPEKMAASTILQTAGIAQFGGDGTDGDLVSATTVVNVDLGGLEYVVKNYASISITGTGSVKFTNPHANGTIIILKCQGLMLLSSSTIPNLSAAGCGGAGGAGGTVAGTPTGSNGNAGIGVLDASIHYGAGGTSTTLASTGGLQYVASSLPFYTKNAYELSRGIYLACGSGGGGGGAVTGNGTGGVITGTADGGAGGNGGGALLIECGSINFTVAGGISVTGNSGIAGGSITSVVGANGYAGSGGGGGAGGMCVVLYKTAVGSVTGTINSAGGLGGAGGNATNTSGGVGGGSLVAYGGGAGGGAYGGAGGNGGATTTANTSTNGTSGAAGGGVSAGSGGGSGAQIVYNVTATNLGGSGGTIGASNGGVVTKNYFLS